MIESRLLSGKAVALRSGEAYGSHIIRAPGSSLDFNVFDLAHTRADTEPIDRARWILANGIEPLKKVTGPVNGGFQ